MKVSSVPYLPMKHLWIAMMVFILPAILGAADTAAAGVPVGTARIDITPQGPIWLSGYSNRAGETQEVVRRLYARAIAIGGDDDAAVLIAVEATGVTEELSDAVAAALKESHGLERSRVAICATHIHTGPAIEGLLPFLYGRDLPDEETARIAQYTQWLRERLIEVAQTALKDRKAGYLAWGEGSASFAINRRKIVDGQWTGIGAVPGGSVDHALPVMRVTDERGGVRAVFVSYACHCTTLKSEDNFIHSDWAGEASARIEANHPGAIALVAIGCAGDANPVSRDSLASAAAHGGEVATEVERLLATPLRKLGSVTASDYRRIELPLDRRVERGELEERLNSATRPREVYATRRFLAELDAGRSLPTTMPYPVQTWSFGDDLAMVFLAGEVVSGYSLRLRRELDRERLWVNAYANSVPAYIAAASMYEEGGYEVDGAMSYYGWPVRLARETEDRVVAAVHESLPATFDDRGSR